MASFKYDIKINSVPFSHAFTKAIEYEVSQFISNMIRFIRPSVVSLLQNRLRNDLNGTYIALNNGILQVDFGFPPGENVGERVVREISRSITLVKIARTNASVGGLRLQILKEGIGFLLNKDFSAYDSNGNLVDWLNWLLTAGDTIVVDDYEVLYKSGINVSRSGGGIMTIRKARRGFRVNPNYSGTEEDNWVTRALSQAGEEIVPLLERALKDAILI